LRSFILSDRSDNRHRRSFITSDCSELLQARDTEHSDQTWRKCKHSVTFIALHKPIALFFSLLKTQELH